VPIGKLNQAQTTGYINDPTCAAATADLGGNWPTTMPVPKELKGKRDRLSAGEYQQDRSRMLHRVGDYRLYGVTVLR
jgi:hypothetical protein